MSYCSNCGGRLNDQGICPNCGGMSESNVTPSKKDDSDVFGCMKTFFTVSPLKAVEKAARTRSASVWVTFSSLFVVAATSLSLAAFGSLSSGFFREISGARLASVVDSTSDISGKAIVSFGALVAHAAIMAILLIVLLTIMTVAAFVHAEEKPTLNQALNIAAFSLFPLSIAMLIAIPSALLGTPFGIMLVLIGLTATAISHYFGIQKASTFKRSPFLTLLCSAIISAVILALCSNGLAILLFR